MVCDMDLVFGEIIVGVGFLFEELGGEGAVVEGYVMESVFLYVVGSVLYASIGVWWLGRVFLCLLREVVSLSGHVILLDTGIFFKVDCFSKVSRWLSDI